MEITHKTHNLRVAPRKLRLVADKVRHQKASLALGLLPLLPQKAALLVFKSLKSAIEVAKDNNLDTASLSIQRVWCDEGSKMKRSVSHSRGRMSRIIKHNSHLSIVLKGEALKAAKKQSSPELEKE